MNNFSLENMFDGFNTADSYAVLFFMIVSFLLGLLVGYLLRGRKVRKLKTEVKELNKSVTDKDTEIAGLMDKIALKDADIKRVNLEYGQAREQLEVLELEKNKAVSETYNLRTEIDKLKSTNQAFLDDIKSLNLEIEELKKGGGVAITTEPEEEDGDEWIEINKFVDDPDSELNTQPESQGSNEQTQQQLAAFERKLQALANENVNLRSELTALQNAQTQLVEKVDNTGTSATATSPGTPEIVSLVDDPNLHIPEVKDVLKGKILTDDQARDDLSLIEGVGPFLEKKLNEQGVFTYADIAQWDQAQIEKITKAIGYLPGRIQKDDWVNQAARLYRIKQENPSSIKAKSNAPQPSTDLKIVEGIGPKIEKILKEGGIETWTDLAQTNPESIRELLDAAGDRYRVHDPGTWPDQARLAANGEWDLLKEYQDELKGGRQVD